MSASIAKLSLALCSCLSAVLATSLFPLAPSPPPVHCMLGGSVIPRWCAGRTGVGTETQVVELHRDAHQEALKARNYKPCFQGKMTAACPSTKNHSSFALNASGATAASLKGRVRGTLLPLCNGDAVRQAIVTVSNCGSGPSDTPPHSYTSAPTCRSSLPLTRAT